MVQRISLFFEQKNGVGLLKQGDNFVFQSMVMWCDGDGT